MERSPSAPEAMDKNDQSSSIQSFRKPETTQMSIGI